MRLGVVGVTAERFGPGGQRLLGLIPPRIQTGQLRPDVRGLRVALGRPTIGVDGPVDIAGAFERPAEDEGVIRRRARLQVRAASPPCKGLTIVPKFSFIPDASDAAIDKARVVSSASSPRTRAAVAAAPIVPIVEVQCHPCS